MFSKGAKYRVHRKIIFRYRIRNDCRGRNLRSGGPAKRNVGNSDVSEWSSCEASGAASRKEKVLERVLKYWLRLPEID